MPTPEENAAAAQAALIAALTGPRRVRTDAGEVEQHDIGDLIEAAKFLDNLPTTAGTSPRRGIRFTKLIPGGTE